MKIAGILVNYKTGDLTVEATTALLGQLEAVGSHHVFVVDNDSGDGSFERISTAARTPAWAGRVSVLAAPRNGGYGYGINFAVRHALAGADAPQYLYVINTDAFADPGSVARLVAFMDAHPDAGLAGSRVHGPDGVTQGAAFRFPGVASELEQGAAFGVLSSLLRRHIVAMPPPAEDTVVDWLPGTSMLIRREVFDGGVYFDEQFFLYFEEVDFARQLRHAGWRSFYVADAPITHIGSVSTGLAEQGKRLPDYWFDSRHRYFLKHHGGAYTAACDAAWVMGYLVFLLKRAALGRSDVLRRHLLRDFLRACGRELERSWQGRRWVDVAGALPGAASPPASAVSSPPAAASELGLARLLAEDFATAEHDPFDPGLWAVLAHRLARRSSELPAGLPWGAGRALLGGVARALSGSVDLLWGINLPPTVELGRRVRLRHGGGGMLLGARAIGNDVQIRHDTTFGPLRGHSGTGTGGDGTGLPIIEDGVDVGSGVSILGGVTVGRRAVVAPNSVVLRDVPPHTKVMGVPSRVVPA